MPVRPDEKVETETRNFGAHGNFTYPKWKWEEIANNTMRIEEWNSVVKEYVPELEDRLNKTFELPVVAKVESYNKLDDNLDNEAVKPRNYLSYEILFVTIGAVQEKYYFGMFPDLEELTETIVQDYVIKHGYDILYGRKK